MAVWGAPTAHEDDAERAVRAALELVDAVRALGAGHPGARRRADRRGRGDARRARTRAWSRATSSTRRRRLQSVAPAGHRARRRGDAARDARARSPSSRPASTLLKGKAAPVAGVARAARRRRARRPRPGRRASRRRSSAATTSCGCSRTCSTRPSRERRVAARLDHGPGRHRQEPARLGVPQVRRRRRRDRLVARGPLARRTARASRSGRSARWSAARAGLLETRRRRRRPARGSPTIARRARPRRRPSGAGSSPRCWRCSASARRRPAARASCSAAWRTFFERLAAERRRRAPVRGPPLGRPGHARLHRPPARVEPRTSRS